MEVCCFFFRGVGQLAVECDGGATCVATDGALSAAAARCSSAAGRVELTVLCVEVVNSHSSNALLGSLLRI